MKKEARHGGNVLQVVASKTFQQLVGEDAGQVQHEKTYRYVKYEAQQRGRLDNFCDSFFDCSSPALIHFHISIEPSLFQRV